MTQKRRTAFCTAPWIIAFAAIMIFGTGCRPARECRPGTVHIVLVCDGTSGFSSAVVHVQDERLPAGKDVAVPLSCPGQGSLELTVAAYSVGRRLAVTVTPLTVVGPSLSTVSVPVQLAPECTATVIHLVRTDASLPTDGPGADEGGDLTKDPMPDGAGGTGTKSMSDAAPSGDGPGLDTASDLTTDGGIPDGSMPMHGPVDTNIPPGGPGTKDASTDVSVDASADAAMSDAAGLDSGGNAVDAPDNRPDATMPLQDAASVDVPAEDATLTDADAPADSGSTADVARGLDAGGVFDASPDFTPPARCDLSKPFGAPTPIVDLPAGAVDVRLSPDELTMYFDAMTGGGMWDLFVAARSSVGGPFVPTGPLSNFNTSGNDLSLTFTADALTAYLESNRNGTYRIYVATRKTAAGLFTAPSLVDLGLSEGDSAPFVNPLGSALYFVSAGAAGSLDLYRASLEPGVGGHVVPLVSLNTTATEAAPVITGDELTVFFASDRDVPNIHGGLDLWVATRKSTSDDFDLPRNVYELNTASDETPTWVSPDGCHLYFDRADARGSTVMIAVHPPL